MSFCVSTCIYRIHTHMVTYVKVFMFIRINMHVCACTCRPNASITSGAFLCCLLLYLLTQDFSIELRTTSIDILACLLVPGSLSLSPKHQNYGKSTNLPSIDIGSGNLNSSPNTWKANFTHWVILAPNESFWIIISKRKIIHRYMDWLKNKQTNKQTTPPKF